MVQNAFILWAPLLDYPLRDAPKQSKEKLAKLLCLLKFLLHLPYLNFCQHWNPAKEKQK